MSLVSTNAPSKAKSEGTSKYPQTNFILSFPDFTRHFFTFYTALLYTFSKTILKE